MNFIRLSLFLSCVIGCSTSKNFNRVKKGMTKSQVLRTVGHPSTEQQLVTGDMYLYLNRYTANLERVNHYIIFNEHNRVEESGQTNAKKYKTAFQADTKPKSLNHIKKVVQVKRVKMAKRSPASLPRVEPRKAKALSLHEQKKREIIRKALCGSPTPPKNIRCD